MIFSQGYTVFLNEMSRADNEFSPFHTDTWYLSRKPMNRPLQRMHALL